MNKRTFAIVLVAVSLLVGVGIIFLVYSQTRSDDSSISTYDECAAAGYPVLMSYPNQCSTPDGRTFIQDTDTDSSVEFPVDDEATADSSDGSAATVTNFDECAAAGYPVMETYPLQCSTPDGQTFVDDPAAQ